MSFTGHVRNGVVVFDEPVSLPEGTQVEIAVREAESTNGASPDGPQATGPRNLLELLRPHVGVLDSSELVAGGAAMSEKSGKKFAEALLKHHRPS